MKAVHKFIVSFTAFLPILPVFPFPVLQTQVPNKPAGIIIKFNDTTAIHDVLQANNLTVEKRINQLNIIVSKTNRDPSLVAQNVMRDRRVLYAEPNFVAQKVRPVRTPRQRQKPTLKPSTTPTPTPSSTAAPTATPNSTVTPTNTPTPTVTPTPQPIEQPAFSSNDTYYTQQWALQKIGWNKLDPTSPALNDTQTSRSTVAVVDTGVNYNHPDLRGKIDTVNDVDYVNNDSDAMDDDGHGTHVAGIITAATNNSQGVAAVGYNDLQVLPIKVLDNQGYGYYSDIAQGIVYATDLGVPVINVSLGGLYASHALEDAVTYAWQKGSMVVAAAGNSGNTRPLYPAYYSSAIAVGASDQNDRKALFSNYGSWVDLVAPGVAILSTTGNSYESWSGTSMATPHVAALAGLIVAERQLTNQQTRLKLESTADPMPSELTFTRGNFGKGRISVYRALTQ